MKYIRTKDGVYEVKSWHDYDLSGRVYETMDKQHIDTIEVMKVADAIEELCDCFVSECEILGKVMQDYLYDFDLFKKRWFEGYNSANFYGAIKVKGKGLIYVAKMNDKGELELL